MKSFSFFVFAVGLLGVSSCVRNSAGSSVSEGGDTVTVRSDLLTLVDHDGYSVVTVRDPWDSTRVMATYLLVDRDVDEENLPQAGNAVVLRVPLEKSLVYSGVHGGAVEFLGEAERIAAVADGSYFTNPVLRKMIDGGRIADVGNSMSPSVERIVEIEPDAILTSPYQNSGHGAIESLAIPIVEMADYMESTPLGRAEWIKFIGRLYGERAKSDSIFAAVVGEYGRLRAVGRKAAEHPVVLVEQPLSGVWALPAGESYMARMIADAGGVYPWADTGGSGSIELDPAAVLARAENADVWFIRSYGPLTLGGLVSQNPLNGRFRPVESGSVYVCDTSVCPLYDEFPFRPHLLLADYVAILHPSLGMDSVRYYRRAVR